MKFKLVVFLFLVAVLASSMAIAWSSTDTALNDSRRHTKKSESLGCLTTEANEKHYHNASPEEKAQMDANRIALEKRIAKGPVRSHLSQGSDREDSLTPYMIIPVVFHVIHGGGVENITDRQIQDAVDQMNEDFNGWRYSEIIPEFQDIYADIGYKFVLARKDPLGNPTDGIERIYLPDYTVLIIDGNDEYQLKKNYNWPQSEYVNIWVIRSAGLQAGSAWAYYPSGGDQTWDGVVSSHWAIGRTGTATSTHYKILTHEIGHWAYLYHTFQGGCAGDDYVDDTPVCTTGSGCVLYEYPCGPLANRQNYMDYGTCTNMFTLGQRDRMDATMNSTVWGRKEIWQPANLQRTGVMGQPVSAMFYQSRNFTTPGGTISFTDISEAEVGSITSWQWSFPGGAPSTHNGQTPPPITYSEQGIYEVTLTVSNGTDSNTVTKTGEYIAVSNEIYMQTNTVEISDPATFYDDGYTGKYSNREDHVLTMLPFQTGNSLTVSFTQFSLDICANDYLEIYNGSDTESPLIGTYCGTTSPGVISASNPDGALTFVFHSNVSERFDGWVADINSN